MWTGTKDPADYLKKSSSSLFPSITLPCHSKKKRASDKRKPFCYMALSPNAYSAEERTLPSLMRLAITSSAMDFGTASYCLKIIEKVPRPCVTVRMAFE